MAGAAADVAVGSPLALVGLFTTIVRERFRAGNGLPWVWSPEATPLSSATNEPDAPRKILIEAAFSEGLEVRNFRPAIFIDRGDITPGKVAIGNFIGQHLPTAKKGYYALASCPIDIEIVAERKGESSTLADLVWFYVLAGRDLIRSTFAIHELTPPVLGRTLPFEQDKTAWSTHVSFEIQYDLRWSTVPISPLLADVVMKFKASGHRSFDSFLMEQYIP